MCKGVRPLCTLLSDFFDCCQKFWSYYCRRDYFEDISGKIGDDACAECCGKGETHLSGKPYCAEGVAYCKTDNHSEDGRESLPGYVFHKETLDQCEKEKTNEISPGRAGKLSESAAETGEYGQPGCAETEIYKDAEGSGFHTESIDRDVYCKVCERQRDRADGDGNGKGSEDTEDRCHESDQCEIPGSVI